MITVYTRLVNNQSISSENSGKNSGIHSSFCPDLSIVTGSSNQDQTNERIIFFWRIQFAKLKSNNNRQ